MKSINLNVSRKLQNVIGYVVFTIVPIGIVILTVVTTQNL